MTNILINLNHDKMMKSLTLFKRFVKLNHNGHLKRISPGELENFFNFVIHNFVIMCSTMKFCVVFIHVHRVLTSWNQHWELFEACDDITLLIAKSSRIYKFIIEAF